MSNGIGPNPLNDLSKVYLEQVAKKKKDDTYLEPDFKKRQANNEKARKELAKGPQMKNPHFEEKEHGWDAVNSLSKAYKEMQEGIRDIDPEKGTAERKARLEKKRGMKVDDHPQYKKEEVEQVDEAMSSYDRNRKRAAQRAAARNAARDAGKTGAVPGVGYVTPRRERETYVDSAGTTRHKSGARMEEVEQVDEADSLAAMQARREKRLARQRKQMGTSSTGQDFGHDYGISSAERKKRQQAEFDKFVGKKTKTESLDPVGQEDKDIDNDGDHDKTDKYLHKRRKAIGRAIKKKMSEQEEKIGGGNLKKLAGKATKRIDADNDGDVDKDDPKEKGMGEFVPSVDGKKKLRTSVKTESYSWRKDLAEIMTDDIDSKPIKEKKVNNKIKINPKLGESLEQLGGELIEMVEVDEFDCIVEEVYQGLLSEGYNEQLATDAIEYGIEEAKVTYGHDTEDRTERTRDKLKKKAKGFLGKIAYKAYNKARDLKRAAEPAVQRAKTSAKRSIRKAALKVADKLKEESSMSPQEVALQKRKSVLDQMIARKRMQDLQKNKEKETPSKAMGEESAYEKVKASMGKAFIDTKKLPKRQHWSKEHMRKDYDPKRYDKKND